VTTIDFDVRTLHNTVFGESSNVLSQIEMIDALCSWVCSTPT